jgi:hypothetical protein
MLGENRLDLVFTCKFALGGIAEAAIDAAKLIGGGAVNARAQLCLNLASDLREFFLRAVRPLADAIEEVIQHLVHGGAENNTTHATGHAPGGPSSELSVRHIGIC